MRKLIIAALAPLALAGCSTLANIPASPNVVADKTLLDERGFEISPRIGTPGDYVIERAFVER